MRRRVEHFPVGEIVALDGRREVDSAAVRTLAESIQSMGLRMPITIRVVDGIPDVDGEVCDGVPVLVTGAHRLAAVRQLGWQEIECFIFDGDDEIDAQLWEIAENLHRAELTTLQRSEQIAEWVRLMEAKREKEKLRQVDAVSDEPAKGGRGKEGGVRAASRDLGIKESSARRAVNIANKLTDEAKALARDYGLDNNQSALERIARANDQVEEVEKIEDERVEREKAKTRKVTPMPHPPEVTEWSETDEEVFVKVIDLLEKHGRVRVAVADYLAGLQIKTAP